MMAATTPDSLLDRLPHARGRVSAHAPLADKTWFRVGGPAEVLFRPADLDDLVHFLAGCPADVPLTVIGAASNLIVRDGGIPGLVVRLARGFGCIRTEPDGIVCGAGALDATVAEHAAVSGLAGLEFLSGIPGTIGGAVAMNAGAYGTELKDVLDWVECVSRDGRLLRLANAACGFSYRHSSLPEGAIVVRARLRAASGEAAAIAARMAMIRESRESTQPVRARTGGSTFRNPPGSKAWELIDHAGCRGLSRGGAQVSEKHANFLLNTGDATAADIEELGEEVRRRVHAATGVMLEWEIRRVGTSPSPALGREREGPIAEQWEGEGGPAKRAHRAEPPSPSHAFGAGPSLSRNAGEGIFAWTLP
jgi:UDP-N-acetylmuramate dehydrogenase